VAKGKGGQGSDNIMQVDLRRGGVKFDSEVQWARISGDVQHTDILILVYM